LFLFQHFGECEGKFVFGRLGRGLHTTTLIRDLSGCFLGGGQKHYAVPFYKQKSGGCPLLGASSIGSLCDNDSSTGTANLQDIIPA
jgi:hypothetical protein